MCVLSKTIFLRFWLTFCHLDPGIQCFCGSVTGSKELQVSDPKHCSPPTRSSRAIAMYLSLHGKIYPNRLIYLEIYLFMHPLSIYLSVYLSVNYSLSLLTFSALLYINGVCQLIFIYPFLSRVCQFIYLYILFYTGCLSLFSHILLYRVCQFIFKYSFLYRVC